ncbi:parathyroid hormone/parathyroid hormone-related peptide receptor [Plakobranchus ocellatus]|uniref:Parathyroid hormone/parathyroid hormone-related peptide receptor n=1 Tax=Plakobranchus ocellatus TaxID=259542 RepID=A0AAV4C067_9GAST|nr:parathyroid hormone/parathyroid hormone-related peptide receptor [Plakobranchus ocellatus]
MASVLYSDRSSYLRILEILTVLTALLHRMAGNKTSPAVFEIDLNDPLIQQRIQIFNARQECYATLQNISVPDDGGTYCYPLWDDVMCWSEYVPAGTLASQPCPAYIIGFNIEEKAWRRCMEDGTWDRHPDPTVDDHYTDFSNCEEKNVPKIIMKHMPILKRISTIGYSISIVTLILAIFIMVYFKKLHCPRNTIHINLFSSFLLRALISVIRNCLLVEGFALPSDISYQEDGTIIFNAGKHWECKLLNTLWIYALMANYFWIFVEGLYLHTLIFFDVFSPSKRFFKLYFAIGWALPLSFIITWVIARIFHSNELCWNTHSEGLYWIIEAPIILTICINLLFFINIIRELFTKIRNCNTRDPSSYKKFAKSTLVLIPMFGVYYIVFIILNRIRDPTISVIYIYLELPLNSLQGSVVALLFCFFNAEVQAEILKKWNRHRLRRQSLIPSRTSRAFSTGSSFLGRDRTSLCMGPVSPPLVSPCGSEVNGHIVQTTAGDVSPDGDQTQDLGTNNKTTLVPSCMSPNELRVLPPVPNPCVETLQDKQLKLCVTSFSSHNRGETGFYDITDLKNCDDQGMRTDMSQNLSRGDDMDECKALLSTGKI